ncbi:HEAT repeat domain-containing protein [Cystobacter fuscus]
MRVRAAAGLLRWGRVEGGELLRRTARQSDEPWLRAEALRWLGALDAPGQVELLERGLRDETWEKKRWPEADEAAWALFRWGTPEALGALLTAWLHGGTADVEAYRRRTGTTGGTPLRAPASAPDAGARGPLHRAALRGRVAAEQERQKRRAGSPRQGNRPASTGLDWTQFTLTADRRRPRRCTGCCPSRRDPWRR